MSPHQGARAWLLLTFICAAAHGQAVHGIIAGRVVDGVTGKPVPLYSVTCRNIHTGQLRMVDGDASGYLIAWVPPGSYVVRVQTDDYLPAEIYAQEVRVAERIEVDFNLRSKDDLFGVRMTENAVGTGRRLINFFGEGTAKLQLAAVELPRSTSTLTDTTLSYVLRPDELDRLPLAGRDAYSLLVLQPGVTADLSTGRGLGLAANGQRPSASNFFLDGVTNNNELVTGPATLLPPEAVQEYRMSTTNVSTEYGGTSGYITNAVSISGTNAWHGLVYFYLKNTVLNAGEPRRKSAIARIEASNSSTSTANMSGRPELSELEPGLSISGPLKKDRAFLTLNLDHLRLRTRLDPQEFVLPTELAISGVRSGSVADQLFERFKVPIVTGTQYGASTYVEPPSSLNRNLGLLRIDFAPASSRARAMFRLAHSGARQPDFGWTPYADFVTPLNTRTDMLVATVLHERARFTNEVRAGVSNHEYTFDRRWPDIPSLGYSENPSETKLERPLLPGSPALFAFSHQTRRLELIENLAIWRGRHLLKIGAQASTRSINGAQTVGRDALVLFDDFGFGFADDAPSEIYAGVSRPSNRAPQYARTYRHTQFSAFAEDTWRFEDDLTIIAGLRLERFGRPVSKHSEEHVVVLGPGEDLPAKLGSAEPSTITGDVGQYSADPLDVSLRFGLAKSFGRGIATSLRAGYALFHAPLFDSLWLSLRNNSVALGYLEFASDSTFDYVRDLKPLIGSGALSPLALPELTLFQPGLRTPYTQTYFGALQRQLARGWIMEIASTGSLGRKLITSDVVNRPTAPDPYNPGIPANLIYRANQGTSWYQNLTGTLRGRARWLQAQASYTLSHSIDNQSDPMMGEFLDLSFTSAAGRLADPGLRSAFTRQYDSSGDRSNADFDQRHNILFYGILEAPVRGLSTRAARIFSGWQLAFLGAVRSGFPYSVIAAGDPLYINNRASLKPGANPLASDPHPHGKLLLNASAFARPEPGSIGNTGRNSFRGPGLGSLDISVARTIRAGEKWRIQFRADAFNVLNHANLNNPESNLASPEFGVAVYGRRGRAGTVPWVQPLDETARRIQLLLRLYF